jgi:CoA:oxalate CoA-transferase
MQPLLSGLRVLDLTNVLAGPFCAYQMALMGAEVIKVETPEGGDLARQLGADPALSRDLMGASFIAQNAGKMSITLNLKAPRGRQAFEKLVQTADVVVENFRPGVMDRIGIGEAALRQRNPRLIYCAISGFGQTGPMKGAPAYDQIIQGLSGAMSVTGDRATAPLRVGYPVADSVGGITAAFAIASALVRRERTGVGAFLDVSMLDSTMVTMGWILSNYLLCGVEPEPMGNDNFTAAPSGAFRTADGLLNIAANKQEQFATLCRLIGRPDLADDPRFAGREARKKNRAALTVEIEKQLAARPAQEWEAILNEAGVPAGRVLSVPQALGLEQVKTRNLVRSIGRAQGLERDLAVAGPGFAVDGAPVASPAPPPRLGQQTRIILQSLGYGEAEITAMHSEGAI